MFPDEGVGSRHSGPASVAAPVGIPSGSRALTRPGFRAAEKILIGYFLYIALLATVRALGATRIALAWFVVAAISALVWAAVHHPRKRSAVLRDWLPLALILVGYWELQWFASSHALLWQQTWVIWDQHLLGDWGLRRAIEVFGPVIPSILETVYLLVYAIPPFCVAALYTAGARDRVDRLLATLFLGCFSAYALLPFFPTTSPRVAFPGSELPNFGSLPRTLNLWLLNHFDISTSVFPSGHVTVAFASAFGLWRALPERRWLSYSLFVLATVVYIATIYSRYHYAVDGLAGAGIALLAWRTSEWVERHV